MKLSEWKLLCPYGKWTCADGREVLFNRQYWPILERRPGEPVRVARPGEWVRWRTQDHFFDDGDSPWRGDDHHRFRPRSIAALDRVNAVLAEWGLSPLPPPPKSEPWKTEPSPSPRRNLWSDIVNP
jgi:hypothetical protein